MQHHQHFQDTTVHAPTRTQVEPDQGYIRTILKDSGIPPMDGAVREEGDYYSLGDTSPQAWRGPTRPPIYVLVLGVAFTFIGASVIGYYALKFAVKIMGIL